MAKTKSFICSACGASFSKWSGRCEACGDWNTIAQEVPLSSGPASKSLGAKRGSAITLTDLSTEESPPPRTLSGMGELDRVLGGGLVPASAILVGGDPGIGKSTLLLQAAAKFANAGLKTLYVSGEEASAQVRMRAQRLELADAPVKLATETNLRDILTTLEAERPQLAIIDSIQTMWADNVDSAPGSVSQVRASAHELTGLRQTARRVDHAWWATSPRMVRSQARAWSSTWSIRCSISKASAAISSAFCARSRTALARRMRLACSR